MVVAKCVCVFEDAKSNVASSVRKFAGFASNEGLNVIKRNKDLKAGDFIVFAPIHRTEGHIDTVCRNHYVCCDENLSNTSNVDLSAEAKDDHDTFQEIPVIVERTWEAERGKYFVKLSRSSLYGGVLKQVLFSDQGICDRCAIAGSDGSAIVNYPLLNDMKATDHDQLTLDQLRLLMASEHVGNLLLSNGFSVTYARYPVMEFAYDFMNKHFGTYTKLNTVEASSSVPESVSSTGCEDVLEKYRNSPYATEIDCIENDKRTEVALDLQRFISDHFSSSEMLQSAYQKNFSKVQFNCFSSLVCQIDHLECQRIKLEHSVQEKRSVNCSEAERTMLCIHVTSNEEEFKQQQVATAWHILEPKVAVIKQVHVVCGRVSSRNELPVVSAQDYFKLKHQQVNDAFIMKYGNELQGEEWKENVLQLTKAVVRFDLLSTVCRQQVKLDFSVETSNGDNKGGVFVMYNFARLSTLFCHFEDAVKKGTYPALPTIDSVDFATLKQEEEWGLLFNYILLYPSIVRDAVAGLRQKSSGSIQTHKICQFLLSLSNSLSSYYSKTHILCESRPHLMPIMFARLYLMKAIREVMHDCLNLLAIQPCAQL